MPTPDLESCYEALLAHEEFQGLCAQVQSQASEKQLSRLKLNQLVQSFVARHAEERSEQEQRQLTQRLFIQLLKEAWNEVQSQSAGQQRPALRLLAPIQAQISRANTAQAQHHSLIDLSALQAPSTVLTSQSELHIPHTPAHHRKTGVQRLPRAQSPVSFDSPPTLPGPMWSASAGSVMTRTTGLQAFPMDRLLPANELQHHAPHSASQLLNGVSPTVAQAQTPTHASEPKLRLASNQCTSDDLPTLLQHTYPTPLVALYEIYEAETDPVQKLKQMVWIFVCTLRLMCYPLLLRYLYDSTRHDAEQTRMLLHFQSASPEVLLEFLSTTSKCASLESDSLSTAVLEAYLRLEDRRPQHKRFVCAQRYLDPLGQEQVAYLRLGLIEALVMLEQGLKETPSLTPAQAQVDLDKYSPLLDEFLMEMSWFARYQFLFIESKEDDVTRKATVLAGRVPMSSNSQSLSLPKDAPSMSVLYLQDKQRPQRLLCLSPLVVPSPPTDLKTYPTLQYFCGSDGQALYYQSHSEERYVTKTGFEEWHNLLRPKIYPPAQNCNAEQLQWRARQWSQRALTTLQEQQIFMPALSISRRQAEKPLAHFYAGQSLSLFLTGEAGIGKTTMLAMETKRLLKQQKAVFYIHSQELKHESLCQELSRILGLQAHSEWDMLLEELGEGVSQEHPLLLFFDALDDHPDYEALLKDFDTALHTIAHSPLRHAIKLLLCTRCHAHPTSTMRQRFLPKSWSYFFAIDDPLGFTPASIALELQPFTTKELKKAFEGYHTFENIHGMKPFSTQTTWAQLCRSSHTRALLHHPYLLRLALTTYCEQELPKDLEFHQLFCRFVDEVIEEKWSPQPNPERLQLLRDLIAHLQETQSVHLDRRALAQAPQALQDALDIHSPRYALFQQLLRLGVLIEHRHITSSSIQFASHLWFGYFLDELEATRPKKPSMALSIANVDRYADTVETPDYLHQPRLRHTQLQSWARYLHNEEIHELVEQLQIHLQSPPPLVLLRSFLCMLVRTDSAHWRPLIIALLQEPQPSLFEVFRQTADRLLRECDFDAAKRLLDLLQDLCGGPLLPTSGYISGFLLRQARLLEMRGEMQLTRQMLESTLSQARHENNPVPFVQAVLRYTPMLEKDGTLFQAEHLLREAHTWLEIEPHPSLLARILRRWGNLHYQRQDLEQAQRCYQRSLQLEEATGNTKGLAASLSNLATVLGAHGRLEDAFHRYQRCLHIQQRLGDRRKVAMSLNNIGLLLKSQGHTDEALAHMQEALELRETLQLPLECLQSHRSISHLLKQTGELQGAIEHLKQCLKIEQKHHTAERSARSHKHLGDLYMLTNELELATEHYHSAWGIFERHQEHKHAMVMLSALGRVLENQGIFDRAEQRYKQASERLQKLSLPCAESISIPRALGRIAFKTKRTREARQYFHASLQCAHQQGNAQELFHSLIEMARFQLSQNQQGAAKEYIDHACRLSQELQSEFAQKDSYALLIQLALREKQEDLALTTFQQLQTLCTELPFDPNPEETAHAYFEIATRAKLPAVEALSYLEQAQTLIQHRFFMERSSLQAKIGEMRTLVAQQQKRCSVSQAS